MMFDAQTLIQLIILGLAVYRLTYLLVFEDGALGMFQKIRDWAGVRQEATTVMSPLGQRVPTTQPTADNIVGKILSCFFCCSIWTSMIPAAYIVWMDGSPYPPERFGLWIVYVLALSGIAIQLKART